MRTDSAAAIDSASVSMEHRQLARPLRRSIDSRRRSYPSECIRIGWFVAGASGRGWPEQTMRVPDNDRRIGSAPIELDLLTRWTRKGRRHVDVAGVFRSRRRPTIRGCQLHGDRPAICKPAAAAAADRSGWLNKHEVKSISAFRMGLWAYGRVGDNRSFTACR